jgi:hypothetical protein
MEGVNGMDNKINEILGKYFSPEKMGRSTQDEVKSIKQISDTLNSKLDAF